MTDLLELRNVTVRFAAVAGKDPPELTAVDAVSFSVGADEMLGLVGESGCGKSTLGRAILRLVPLAGGELYWRGQRIDTQGRREFRALRRELQLVFQDPHACLDPRMTIVESVAEPLRALVPELTTSGRTAKALELLDELGLARELAHRYPHQFSGGQLQRAVIARALIVAPRFIVCDE
ncbi:MAG: ATP-binding cassette domain-containing protein, partial [Sphingomonadaceae bacterium]